MWKYLQRFWNYFFLQQEEPHQQSQSIRDGFYTIAIIIVKRIMHVKLITY